MRRLEEGEGGGSALECSWDGADMNGLGALVFIGNLCLVFGALLLIFLLHVALVSAVEAFWLAKVSAGCDISINACCFFLPGGIKMCAGGPLVQVLVCRSFIAARFQIVDDFRAQNRPDLAYHQSPPAQTTTMLLPSHVPPTLRSLAPPETCQNGDRQGPTTWDPNRRVFLRPPVRATAGTRTGHQPLGRGSHHQQHHHIVAFPATAAESAFIPERCSKGDRPAPAYKRALSQRSYEYA